MCILKYFIPAHLVAITFIILSKIMRNPFPIQLMLTNCTTYLPLLQFISRNILGADIFRLNFSHGEHQQKADLVKIIRDIEKKYDHPIAILADLQVHN
jgi:Pyruvate kinase, barrel domain